MPDSNDIILEIRDLKMHFPVKKGLFSRTVGQVRAVDGVSLKIRRGETVGLVGESGCGKSTLGRCVIRLYDPTEGRIFFNGRDISQAGPAEMRALRKDMQIIFQDPNESLNSRHSVEEILEEPFIIHDVGSPEERRIWIRQLLSRVGLPESAAERYPHEFSGGQRQRIGIARAIALKPKLIVCDEAVSALDVSIQSQVLNLLMDLQDEMNLTYIFIAHGLPVVKLISDRIAVMYLGKVVEFTSSQRIYDAPQHPYTQALISAIPEANPEHRTERIILQGDVPSPINPPSGCAFHPRCRFATERCKKESPQFRQLGNDEHWVACHHAGELVAQ